MSEPSKPVQLNPVGLLNLLQVKNLGKNPDTLIGEYQPTIEMLEWLMSTEIVGAGSTFTLVAPGSTATWFATVGPIKVPDNEWWYVHSASAVLPMAAGDTFQGSLAVGIQIPQGAGAYYEYMNVLALTKTAGAAATFHTGGPIRRWYSPGCEFGIAYGALTNAANVGGSLWVNFTRLPI